MDVRYISPPEPFFASNQLPHAFLVLIYCLAPIAVFVPLLIALALFFFLSGRGVRYEKILLAAPFFLFSIVGSLHSINDGATSLKQIVDIFRWIGVGALIMLVGQRLSRPFILGFYLFFLMTFMFCLIQQLLSDVPIVLWISSQYVSGDLISELFVPGFVRSTGFNEGPGHVGLVALCGVIASDQIGNYLKFRKMFVLLGHLMGWGIIVMAAAKGAAIALLLYVILFHLRKYFIFIVLSGIVLFMSFDDVYFFIRMLSSESGSERMKLWISILDVVISSSVGLIWGVGRVGQLSGVSIFDSDLVFIFVSLGLVGVISFFILLLSISFRIFSLSASAVIFAGVLIIAGFSNPFLTDIKFAPLYFCLLTSLGGLCREGLHYNCRLW